MDHPQGRQLLLLSFVVEVWNDSFDTLDPRPVSPRHTPDEAKAILSEYFSRSYVGKIPSQGPPPA